MNHATDASHDPASTPLTRRDHVYAHHPSARPWRTAALAVAASAIVLATASPALAHAEVSASDSRALAKNVTLTFESEAESESAGFTEIRTVLPESMDGAGDGIRLKDAPKGWKLKPTSDGYSVAGPALEPGENAEHSVVVEQLPDAKSLAFKTVETYEDGEVSRWIELPRDGEPEPENPAPVLKLKPAAPGAAEAAASASASASPSASSASSTPEGGAPSPDDSAPSEAATSDDGSPWPTVAVVAGLCLVALVGGVLVVKRRGRAGTE
ncbi:DUF1775 domain-containing protein [Streptomyces sp. NPDC021354]|uniref:DUF1775 domain-containing protein n=1 Tax=Streptomyces sp. NPDC021354 TaxID=3154793 RepID=UPI0033D98B38